MPSWLLSKPALLIGGALLVGGVFTGWLFAHDATVRERDRAKQSAARFDSLAVAKKIETARKDSLHEVAIQNATTSRLRTDTERRAITAASTSYARQRASVNTTAPQRPGLAPDSIVVSRAFVASADSMAREIPNLLGAMAVERAMSQREREASAHVIESMMALDSLRVQEIAALRIAVQAAKPGVTGHLKDYAIGAAIGVGAYLLLGRQN